MLGSVHLTNGSVHDIACAGDVRSVIVEWCIIFTTTCTLCARHVSEFDFYWSSQRLWMPDFASRAIFCDAFGFASHCETCRAGTVYPMHVDHV